MNAALVQNSEINRTEWDVLVSGSPQGSVFMNSGYLDAILPGQWQGIVVYKNNEIQAVMPLNVKKKYGLLYTLQPFFTKYWGIAFAARSSNNVQKEFSWKKKVINAIIKAIPDTASFEYNFHPGFDYPLPFYWENYQLRTKYTFRLPTASVPMDTVFRNYTDSLKNSIRTAQKNNIRIEKGDSASTLIHLLKENDIKGKNILDKRYYDGYGDVFRYCEASGSGFILNAADDKNETIASSLYLQDQKSVYALIHMVRKDRSQTDALSLLVHEAITEANNLGLDFDFLGSMIEPVEAFNRRFGASPVAYLNISRKNKLIRIIGK